MSDTNTQDDKDSSADLEEQYEDLFESIGDIVEASPEHVPELLTVILALPPFRDFLDRQELLTKAVVEAKKMVKEAESSMTDQDKANAAVAGQRPLNVKDLMPRGPAKA